MYSIKACAIPDQALLRKYLQSDHYTDCYRAEIGASVTQAEYISAFYTSRVFKIERLILDWAVSKPSSDTQAGQLADASIDEFAAWHVESRCENQLLLSDFRGRTRSWLMTLPAGSGPDERTILYFGSAVTDAHKPAAGHKLSALFFTALLEFHKIYSRVLLYAACLRLTRHGS